MRFSPRAYEPLPDGAFVELAQFRTMTDALEVSKAMDGFPVFSVEVFANSEARVWCVNTFAEMAAWMRAAPPASRRVHELVSEDIPCKFVADLDGKTADPFFEGKDESFLGEALEELRERVQKLLNLKEKPRVVVGSSTRPKKLSLHATFPDVVLKNWTAAAALGMRAWEDSERENTTLHHILDRNVYARERGTLRTMFSTSYTKPGVWMRPIGHSDKFSKEIFFESLVTFVDPALPDAILLDFKYEWGVKAKKTILKKGTVPDAFGGDLQLFGAVRDALAEAEALRTYREHGTYVCADDLAPTSDSFAVYLKSFPCRFRDDTPHSGNRTRVTWTLGSGGDITAVTYTCLKEAEPCYRRSWHATPTFVNLTNMAFKSIREEVQRSLVAEEAVAEGGDGSLSCAMRCPMPESPPPVSVGGGSGAEGAAGGGGGGSAGGSSDARMS